MAMSGASRRNHVVERREKLGPLSVRVAIKQIRKAPGQLGAFRFWNKSLYRVECVFLSSIRSDADVHAKRFQYAYERRKARIACFA